MKLAHGVSEDQKFELNLLVGAEYYWEIVQNRIVRGKGPTTVKSRLGYLLSGPLISRTEHLTNTTMMNILINHKVEVND